MGQISFLFKVKKVCLLHLYLKMNNDIPYFPIPFDSLSDSFEDEERLPSVVTTVKGFAIAS